MIAPTVDPFREQCRECKVVFTLTVPNGAKGTYIPQHTWRPSWSTGEVPCHGSGRRSLQHVERGRANRLLRHHRAVIAIKDTALVALDAWADGRTTDFDFEKMVDLALVEYRYKYKLAFKGTPFVVQHRRKLGRPTDLVDIYCRFCRGLIITRTTKGTFDMQKVRLHTTGCALQCLAGVRDMMSPHHVGLIDEDRNVYATNDQMTLKET